MAFNPKLVVGKTIERVEMNPWINRSPGGSETVAHAPVIFFTDGTKIFFVAEETESEPGVDIIYVPRQKK